MQTTSRRRFLKTATAGGALLSGLLEMPQLASLPRVSAEEAKTAGKLAGLGANAALVKLLEETPREKLLEAVAAEVRAGRASYRDVLAALLLAGVRNVEPRPAVGFKFHAVLVVHSAHLAAISGPDSDRWLPIFWALDYFKAKQLEEQRTSGWRLAPVNEAKLPSPHKAEAAFLQAMNSWDVEAADVAVAAFARSAGSQAVFDRLFDYGGRDYRSIGHKAIYVANTRRALDCIGWTNAEPVLRSLVYALLNHTGEPNPSENDLGPDRPWRRNAKRRQELPADWLNGKHDSKATRELIAILHGASEDDAPAAVVEMLGKGVSPQSIWDAVLVASGELLMRQPGIIGLHSLTTANALHYAYSTCSREDTRQMTLLQAAAFLPKFRESAKGRGQVTDATIDDIAVSTSAGESSAVSKEEMMAEIFQNVSRDRGKAAIGVRRFLADGGSAEALIRGARQLVFLKGRDAHDYKFSSAVLEDYYHVSPAWRDLFLSLSVFNLRGSGERDNGLVEQIRGVLA